MLKRDEIVEILKQARSIDCNCELFGAKKHKYQLNQPISISFVRALEENTVSFFRKITFDLLRKLVTEEPDPIME